jgi:hypothetical protein
MVEKGRMNMLDVAVKAKRESLFQEISRTVSRWPEREREVFAQAHYQGQSLEAISRSLQINPEEISAILRLCEQRLHNSLRDFRKSDNDKTSAISAESLCSSFCRKSANAIQAISSRPDRISDTYRKSA